MLEVVTGRWGLGEKEPTESVLRTVLFIDKRVKGRSRVTVRLSMHI